MILLILKQDKTMKKNEAETAESWVLKEITKELERRFECKVMSINLCSILGTPNVMCKIQYNGDFVYKPCEHWTITTICFSERSVYFTRRIDFFECMKKLTNNN